MLGRGLLRGLLGLLGTASPVPFVRVLATYSPPPKKG